MWYWFILKWLLVGGTVTLFLTLGITFVVFFGLGFYVEDQLTQFLTVFLSSNQLSQVVLFLLVEGGFVKGLTIYLGAVVSVAIVKSVRGFLSSSMAEGA